MQAGSVLSTSSVCRLSSLQHHSPPPQDRNPSLHSLHISSLLASMLELCGAALNISRLENLESLPKSLHLHESHRHRAPHNAHRLPFLPSAFFLMVLDSFARAQLHPHLRHYSDSPQPTTKSFNQECKTLVFLFCFYIPPLYRDQQL